MKLLEYQVDKFYEDCLYSETKKHLCAEKGFRLAKWIILKQEYWLDNEDCTDVDFIKAVYKENIEKQIAPETELFEILARFLCGYDVYEKFKNENLKGIVDFKITNKDIEEKINFIKNCIENN